VVAEEDRDVYDYNLRADIRHLGLAATIALPCKSLPLPVNELAQLYAAADVHLLTSYWEGFGLPTLQAASAGVVPIACLHSANTELVGQHGIAIPSDASMQDEFGIVRHFIDRRKAAIAIRVLAKNKPLLERLSTAARTFSLEYSWDRVALQWDDLFQNLKRANPAAPKHGTVRFAAQMEREGNERIRPTGHSASILPIPRLSIPAKVGRKNADLIIAPRKAAKRLEHLMDVFTGLSILPSDEIGTETLREILKKAILVVDPIHSLHPDIDAACAVAGVSFVGRSSIWPPIGGSSLYLKARAILTDITLAENRLQNAKRNISEGDGRTSDQWA
jgi:hypothetical protein